MLDIGIDYVALLVAAIFVMMFHEFFKYICFLTVEPGRRAKDFKNLFKIHRSIDVIGLIFFITTWAGFSRTSKFKISKTKSLVWIGLTGIISLLVLFSVSAMLSKQVFTESLLPATESMEYILISFLAKTNNLVCLFSLAMIITNLFPLATFDMGYIIAGKSQKAYINILRLDVMLKIVFTLLVLGGWVTLGVDFVVRNLKL